MKPMTIVAFASVKLVVCACAFAESVPVTGYLPAGNVVCANPEKLADMAQTANWGRDIRELPKGCNAVRTEIPLRNARRAGKVICFDLTEVDTQVCAHATRVRESR
jgi:hypothetical protein